MSFLFSVFIGKLWSFLPLFMFHYVSVFCCFNLFKAKAVQQKLINLLAEQYMTVPMKLLILKALDASIFFSCGLKSFTTPSVIMSDSKLISPYRQFINFTVSAKQVCIYSCIQMFFLYSYSN